MKQKDTEDRAEAPIRIDYDNVDVADIMAQIKNRIAHRPPSATPQETPAYGSESPLGYPEMPGEEGGWKNRVKRILLKIMKPITPLIKLSVLPVNEDLVKAIKIIDYTNKRLDYLTAKLEHDLRQVDSALDKKIGDLAVRHGTTRENTKLLHNLAHNLVVELTKLKIEEEALKIKTRIMEKDFETLGRREHVLEKKVFK